MGKFGGLWALVLAAALAVPGCEQDPTSPDAADASPDVMVATDAAVDSGPDALPDAAPPECPHPDLEHAPPPTTVDGLPTVPIDIQTLDATLHLDAYLQVGQVSASIGFRLGPAGGMPVFDLRQGIDTATLDGQPVGPQELAHHDFGGGAGAELRVLERELEPCSSHVLTLGYELSTPDAEGALPLGWQASPAALRWDLWFTDLYAGRYLEMWFPANLIYDRFTFGLDLSLSADVEHTPITNGDVFELAENTWRLEFPPTHTALSPMIVLRPAADLTSETTVETLSNGQSVTLELHRLNTVPEAMAEVRAVVVSALELGVATHGEYPHGDRLVVYVWDEASRSMEYDGGTTSRVESLLHELFHGWYGRGVKPALGRDGWIDEAWTVWNTDDDLPYDVAELPSTASPLVLSPPSPWWRVTPGSSYDGGRLLIGHLAHLLGAEPLQAAMTGFYAAHVLDVVTTAELERHLYCLAQDPAVARAFHRWVYGNYSEPDPADYPVCP